MDRYSSEGAYRRALEDRLRARAQEMGLPLQRLRTRLAMERLLARLFATGREPWLLKGGYAFELRFAPRARTTRDVDLNLPEEHADPDWQEVRDRLQESATRDLGDGFRFMIGPARKELQGAPLGGVRYPVETQVAGRESARFHVDVGAGDPMTGEAEVLRGLDLLDFIGIPPARIRSVPLEQLFAEKLHAYTRPWSDRENTRVKDLIDLLLLEEAGFPSPERLLNAVRQIFERRGAQPVPDDLPQPPDSWQSEFEAAARDLGLSVPDLSAAHARLRACWQSVRSGE